MRAELGQALDASSWSGKLVGGLDNSMMRHDMPVRTVPLYRSANRYRLETIG